MAIVVEPLLNGPYLVKDLDALTNSKGDALPTKDVIALCRCGCSTTKPFCSGMHKEVGFDSANLNDGSLNRRVDYEGGPWDHDPRQPRDLRALGLLHRKPAKGVALEGAAVLALDVVELADAVVGHCDSLPVVATTL